MSLFRLSVLPWWGVLVFTVAWGSGHLEPVVEPDTQSYLDFEFSSARVILSQTRTPLYPLFLQVVGVRLAPEVQAAAYLLASVLFGYGLRRAGFAEFAAALCAVTLMFGRGLFDLAGLLTADSLAISTAIVTTACFLACLGKEGRTLAWSGLSLLTLITVLIRPAYLFLIPLWPLLGVLLDGLVLRRGAGGRVVLMRGAALACAAVGPFLAWATLRLLIAGHWGLVSFGGYNIAGVAVQFVDEEFAEAAPADLQPLCRRILDARARLDGVRAPDSFDAMEAMFNPSVWQIAVPAARELTDDDPVATNRLLSRLSLQVIRHDPGRYVQWLIWNGNHARQEVTRLVAFDKGTVFLLVLVFVVYLRDLLRRGRTGGQSPQPDGEWGTVPGDRRESHMLFWLGTGFLGAKVLLVILVEPAMSRYMIGAGSLIPALFAVWAAHLCQRVAGRQEHL